MSRKEIGERGDVYARITERIVADLEKGVRPWIQPWSSGNATGRITRPLRHTGEPYSGMNVLLLWSEAMARGFASPTWMTFKQANELGGHVRKGESGSIVIYASRFTKTETDAHGSEVERDIPFLKIYSVFNVDQIEGLPANFYCPPPPVFDPMARIEHADRFFAHTGAVIRHGGSAAFYSPSTDHIQMPPFETFRDAASYVAVLSHESVHWTADPRRVGRDLSRYAKDRSERAREELVALKSARRSSAPISASSRRWSPDPTTLPIWEAGLASFPTTSGRSSRPPPMRSVPSPICTACSHRPRR